ncbi:MAG: hypothetical protein GXP26_03605 [Planctomycetes bacterium]|nr:hypothetical protein [Planctomycetota bacterium]
MKIQIAIFAVIASVAVCTTSAQAERPNLRASQYNWNANYAHAEYGRPVALVVPPTANLQTNWSWGSPSAHTARIDHQFGRDYPGPGPFGGRFRSTPRWPSSTHQFGVYNVRGPWYPTQR